MLFNFQAMAEKNKNNKTVAKVTKFDKQILNTIIIFGNQDLKKHAKMTAVNSKICHLLFSKTCHWTDVIRFEIVSDISETLNPSLQEKNKVLKPHF